MIAPQDHDAALLQAGGLPAVVIRNKEQILDRFCKRARQSLDSARGESHPVLIDTLPAFITRIALALAGDSYGEFASQYSNIPLQHGNERARFTCLIGDWRTIGPPPPRFTRSPSPFRGGS